MYTYISFLPLLFDILPWFRDGFGPSIVPFHVEVDVTFRPGFVEH